MAQRQNQRYLDARADYGFDIANVRSIEADNFGMQQDILSLRLNSIVNTLSAEKQKSEQAGEKEDQQNTMNLIVISGVFAIIALMLIYK